eukprot:gene6020-4324_t
MNQKTSFVSGARKGNGIDTTPVRSHRKRIRGLDDAGYMISVFFLYVTTLRTTRYHTWHVIFSFTLSFVGNHTRKDKNR